MKRPVALFTIGLAVTLALTGMSFAGGSNPDKCDTRYPVILAHGMAVSAEILGIIDVWWGIGEALEDEGAVVFKTSVNGMDSTADKAAEFKRQFFEILALTGAEKANIIAHSHGAVYTRYAISNLGLGDYVASYTGLGGPHRGSAIATMILEQPDFLLNASTMAMDFIYAFVFGDTDPDYRQNILDLTPEYMIDVFNPNTPDDPDVYYQSWAAKVKLFCPNPVLELPWLAMLVAEGANDGLISVKSAKWGNFRGVEDAAWWSPGCDHLNMVGHTFGLTPGFDAPQFFVDIVADLKDRGY